VELTANAKRVLEKRYLTRDNDGKIIETPDQLFRRVAKAVAEDERSWILSTSDEIKKNDIVREWEDIFYEVMSETKFLPNSPTLFNAGKSGTLSGCFAFVVEDTMEGIMGVATKAALVQKFGGGVGYCLSHIRAKDSPISSTHGKACGPIRVMSVYHEIAMMITQGGKREGAQMAILHCDHPDVEEFIKCKVDNPEFSSFNISVACTEDFMKLAQQPGTKAHKIFNMIVESAWKSGDPGVFFIDEVDKYNPTPHLGKLEQSNPCVVGDTLVATTKGAIPIRELVGTNPYVFCIDDTGKISVARADNVILSGRKWIYDVVSIGKEGERHIVATEDHLIRLKNGEYKRVIDLKEGDSLSPIEHMLDYNVVTVLPSGYADVYDMSVPKYHNFAANGLFVHNCGEQPLLDNESCNLGSINLANFLRDDNTIDWKELERVTKVAVRFLDNVININSFPLLQIEEATKKTRKIGLGVMGWADLLERMWIPYDSEIAENLANEVMSRINEWALEYSCKLAEEKGAYPAFRDNSDAFAKRAPERNAARTTIAPTGSISIIAGCSSGIEPLFALAYNRENLLGGSVLPELNSDFVKIAKARGFYSEELVKEIANKGGVRGSKLVPEDVQRVFVTSHEISPEWHVRMQAAFQKHTNNAVSKTINMPRSATKGDVAKAYIMAYRLRCKGITIYRDGSKDKQVLNIGEKKSMPTATDHDKNVTPKARSRGRKLQGSTERVNTGCFPAGTKIVVRSERNCIQRKNNGSGVFHRKDSVPGMRNIEDIKVGDFVLTYNEKTSEKEWKKVDKVFKHGHRDYIHLKFSNGNDFWCTDEQPIAVIKKGTISWIMARDVKNGDRVIQYNYPGLNRRIKMRTSVGKSYRDIVGHDFLDETREKYSVAASGENNSQYGVPAWSKGLTKETDARIKASAEKQKENWKDPEFVRRSLSSRPKEQIAMSKAEKQLSYILRSVCPGEFKYNGMCNLGFVVNGHIPDFVNVNGKKKAINVNGCYYHGCVKCGYGDSPNTKDIRHSNSLRKVGYQELTIWEHELIEKDKVKEKVETFVCNPNVDIVTVIERKSDSWDGEVYNLRVEDNHNYFAYGILVHNCGWLYITINRDSEGIREVVASLGKTGGCAGSHLEAIGRLISLCLKNNIDIHDVIRQLRQIRCPSQRRDDQYRTVLSCADAIAKVLLNEIGELETFKNFDDKELIKYTSPVNQNGMCPECGNVLAFEEGCSHCYGCGYERC
jgi:ribonucleoside-diphosphate reductase alpha chain